MKDHLDDESCFHDDEGISMNLAELDRTSSVFW